MSVRGPQRLGLANQHEERSRCSSSLQLARRGLANVPSTAHTAAALQLKKAALDHHIARVSGPDAQGGGDPRVSTSNDRSPTAFKVQGPVCVGERSLYVAIAETRQPNIIDQKRKVDLR